MTLIRSVLIRSVLTRSVLVRSVLVRSVLVRSVTLVRWSALDIGCGWGGLIMWAAEGRYAPLPAHPRARVSVTALFNATAAGAAQRRVAIRVNPICAAFQII